jgi:hypothetical protein
LELLLIDAHPPQGLLERNFGKPQLLCLESIIYRKGRLDDLLSS